MAPYNMTGTFGEVFGPWNHTDSEPRPARKLVAIIAITLRGSKLSSVVPNCSSRSFDHFDIPTYGSMMKIVDARAITVGAAVDPRDARFSCYLALEATKFNIFS